MRLPARSASRLSRLRVAGLGRCQCPGIFVYAAPYALAGRRNDGAIANVGFVIGRDAVAVIASAGACAAAGAAGRTVRTARNATAGPIRITPLPPARSIVALVGIEPGILHVRGLDCLDGTPLLDIKPDRWRTRSRRERSSQYRISKRS
jgi:hypothetical protein